MSSWHRGPAIRWWWVRRSTLERARKGWRETVAGLDAAILALTRDLEDDEKKIRGLEGERDTAQRERDAAVARLMDWTKTSVIATYYPEITGPSRSTPGKPPKVTDLLRKQQDATRKALPHKRLSGRTVKKGKK